MKLNQIKIQEILLKQNYISEEDLNTALKASKPGKLVEYLIETKILSKQLLGQAVAEFYKIKYFDVDSKPVDPKVMVKLPLDLCEQYSCVLLEEVEGKLDVATADPEHLELITERVLEYLPGSKIDFFYTLDSDIEAALQNIKQPLQDRFDQIIRDNYYSAPDIFDEIIVEAFESKASDVHFEPMIHEKVMLRFRVDGLLREIATIPKAVYDKVLNRIKVLAHLQIDEHYSPQDGSIRIDTGTFTMDLRISIIPTIEGEKVVIRILSDYIKDLNIEDLGFDNESNVLLRNALKKRYGMILTTGPTGSGKSTTLYTILRSIKTSTINITTIEDPVEYRIPGVNQIQVDPGHDITFARGLRSIVRQDPNVILVGEIRDNETAEIAVNAALTGHLLLSTFHANDAATAIPRLLDMGIEPFLLSSTLNLIIAQRLIRRICTSCRYSDEYTPEQLSDLLGENAKVFFKEKHTRLYKAKGCDKCNHTGYKGRIAILEMIYISEEIRDLIEKSPSSQDVWNVAKAQGARSFFEEGLGKVLLGITTLEELLRVAPINFTAKHLYATAKKEKK
jgi:type II secretory ATPase GspE/PulE/Tfp pilus assembly ATPase PilB-like protein